MDAPSEPPGPHKVQDPASQIRRRIEQGCWSPGRPLDPAILAREFDLEPDRIRSVVDRLAVQGYLTVTADGAASVRSYTQDDVLDSCRTREVLEGLAARLAAEASFTEEERGWLVELQARMDLCEAHGDVPGFADGNATWHEAVCTLARSVLVTDFLGRVRMGLQQSSLPPGARRKVVGHANAEHRVITTAILAGNGTAAETAMRAHIRAGNLRRLKALRAGAGAS